MTTNLEVIDLASPFRSFSKTESVPVKALSSEGIVQRSETCAVLAASILLLPGCSIDCATPGPDELVPDHGPLNDLAVHFYRDTYVSFGAEKTRRIHTRG